MTNTMKVNMLSRVADGMFWLNRYMERTDGMLLTLNTFYILSFDKEMEDSLGYKPLLEYYTSLSPTQISQAQYDSTYVLKYIVCDSQNQNSVKNLVTKARENARGSQDKITKELWEHINSMYHFMNAPDLPKRLETAEASTIISKLNKKPFYFSLCPLFKLFVLIHFSTYSINECKSLSEYALFFTIRILFIIANFF